jgi:ABC-type phosphate transport system auxiliary subunit
MNSKIAILAALLSAGSLKAGDSYEDFQRRMEESNRWVERMEDERHRQEDRLNERLERQRDEDERRVRDMQEGCDY